MAVRLPAALVAALISLMSITQPAAAQQEVDKTGLDILCTGKGDVYFPPKGGVSACAFADGDVLICDSKTDKCTSALTEGDGKRPTVDGVVTLRLLKLIKLLNDRVDRLESQKKN